MRCIILLLALAATAALLSPCLYAIEYLGKDNNEKLVEVDTLDTLVFDLVFEDALVKKLSISDVIVRGVCKIGPYWDYALYQMSDNILLYCESLKIYSMESKSLTTRQKDFVKGNPYSSFKLSITNDNWQVGNSTFETIFLSKNPTDDTVHLIGGSQQVFDEANIQLSCQTRPKLIEVRSHRLKVEHFLIPFPSEYECIFRSTGSCELILMKTTSEIRLMERKGLSDVVWKTIRMVTGLGYDILHDPLNLFVGRSDRNPDTREKRIYVNNDEEAATSVHWRQNGRKYWMTVVSKPDYLLQ